MISFLLLRHHNTVSLSLAQCTALGSIKVFLILVLTINKNSSKLSRTHKFNCRCLQCYFDAICTCYIPNTLLPVPVC